MRDRFSGWPQLATLFVLALSLAYLAWLGWGLMPGHGPIEKDGFDGQRALALVKDQCEIGPRPAGSPGAWMTGDMILDELQRVGWKTAVDEYAVGDKQLRNLAGLAGESGPLVVIATHYDTRPPATLEDKPSLGANDGASGVAVLLELARVLNVQKLRHRVWLVFLDGEAQPDAPDWEQISGARQFLDGRHPAAVIYLSNVGAADAVFLQVPDANDLLQTQLWKLGARLGYERLFVPDAGPEVVDAHTVFVQAGVPTAEIIQANYPYAGAPDDDCDKLDAETLAAVGVLLESYIGNGDFMTIAPALK